MITREPIFRLCMAVERRIRNCRTLISTLVMCNFYDDVETNTILFFLSGRCVLEGSSVMYAVCPRKESSCPRRCLPPTRCSHHRSTGVSSASRRHCITTCSAFRTLFQAPEALPDDALVMSATSSPGNSPLLSVGGLRAFQHTTL